MAAPTDIREAREQAAGPLLALLATHPTTPEGLVTLMGTSEVLEAGIYLLSRALGHCDEPIARIDWTRMGWRKDREGRSDVWEVRTCSTRALTDRMVGTPMHRYGGDPHCSESVMPPWLPEAPADPAQAVAEVMLGDAGPQGIIDGYDWHKINLPRRNR